MRCRGRPQQLPVLGRTCRGLPAPIGLRSPGTGGGAAPWRAQDGPLPAAQASGCSRQPAEWLGAHSGGRGWGPPSGPRMGKARTGAAAAAHHREAPAGQAVPLTATAVPTADFLLIWNSPPILTSKRKNKLYLPGKNLLPVAWTIAYNICLFQKWQWIHHGFQKLQWYSLANNGRKDGKKSGNWVAKNWWLNFFWFKKKKEYVILNMLFFLSSLKGLRENLCFLSTKIFQLEDKPEFTSFSYFYL